MLTTGASPPSKHPTLLQRMQDKIAAARLFYTISTTTRSAPGFGYGEAILPSLVGLAFAAALRAEDVPLHYVASGEADGQCVKLAREVGGYVLGQDTDFIIFNGQYAPLDMMEWIGDSEPDAEQESEFTLVTGKAKRTRRSNLIPGAGEKKLVLATYTSELLARRLRIPMTLLPLLASLVGNDYTPKNAADLFFPGVRAAERVEKVARVLREIQLKSKGGGADAAVDMVRRAVKLLSKWPLDEKTTDTLVDGLIDATMQYVLPSRDCCSTYPYCGDHSLSPVGEAYANAQRLGYGNINTHNYLYPDRVYIHFPVEDPGMPSVRTSPAAVNARTAAYEILDRELGLQWPPSPEKEEEQRQDAEASALLGVSPPSSEPVEEPQTVRKVIEYVRQGGSVAAREIMLPEPEEADSIALQPLPDRLTAYLTLLDCEAASSLPTYIQPLVAALRIAIKADSWRRDEIEAILRAGVGSVESWRAAEASGPETEFKDHNTTLSNANAQRVAQITAALVETQPLAQALLLLPEDGVTHLQPFVFISGLAMHYLLQGVDPPRDVWSWKAEWGGVYRAALEVVLDGVEVGNVGKKGKAKKSQKEKVKASGEKSGLKNGKKEVAGRFALLEMESA